MKGGAGLVLDKSIDNAPKSSHGHHAGMLKGAPQVRSVRADLQVRCGGWSLLLGSFHPPQQANRNETIEKMFFDVALDHRGSRLDVVGHQLGTQVLLTRVVCTAHNAANMAENFNVRINIQLGCAIR